MLSSQSVSHLVLHSPVQSTTQHRILYPIMNISQHAARQRRSRCCYVVGHIITDHFITENKDSLFNGYYIIISYKIFMVIITILPIIYHVVFIIVIYIKLYIFVDWDRKLGNILST